MPISGTVARAKKVATPLASATHTAKNREFIDENAIGLSIIALPPGSPGKTNPGNCDRIGLAVSSRSLEPSRGGSQYPRPLDSRNGTRLPFESHGLYGSYPS